MSYYDKKIRRTPTHDIREHWTAISTLLGLVSSVYRNLHHWRSNLKNKKNYIHLFPCPWGIIITRLRISKLLGKTWPWGGDSVLWKEFGCNMQDTFRLFSHAITITCWFWTVGSVVEYRLCNLWSLSSISRGGDYGIRCWRDLLRSKQLSSVPVCRA